MFEDAACQTQKPTYSSGDHLLDSYGILHQSVLIGRALENVV